MLRSQKKYLLMSVYVIIGIMIFYFYEVGIRIGSFTILLKYILSIFLIGIGFLQLLIYPELKEAGRLLKAALVLTAPYLISLVISLVLWILNNPGISTITRGGFNIIYQCIAVLTAVSAAYVFKKNGVYIFFTAFTAAYLILIYKEAIALMGLNEFISSYIVSISSFGTEAKGLGIVEDTGLQFAFGCFLMYFLIDDTQSFIKRLPFIFISLLLFSVAFKRITVPAVIVALFVSMLVRRTKKDSDYFRMMLIAGTLVIIAAGYIAVCKLDLLQIIYSYLNIDAKGRSEFVAYFDSFYSLSPLYRGYGLGYTNRLMEVLYNAGKIDAAVLHNDFLRIYLELGFAGFFIWLFAFWPFRFSYFCRNENKRVLRIVTAVSVYTFINFLTDNTIYYYNVNLAGYIVIFSSMYPWKTASAAARDIA